MTRRRKVPCQDMPADDLHAVPAGAIGLTITGGLVFALVDGFALRPGQPDAESGLPAAVAIDGGICHGPAGDADAGSARLPLAGIPQLELVAGEGMHEAAPVADEGSPGAVGPLH